MEEERMRNHPTVMVQNTVILLFVIACTGFGFVADAYIPGIIACAIISIAGIGLIYLAWTKTTLTVSDSGLIVRFDLIYHKKKDIPWEKIASVNVTRNIFNRIFMTTTLSININSNVNANRPEARFCFDNMKSEELRSLISNRMYKQEYETQKDKEYESLIKCTMKDSIMYGSIGKSTYQFLFGVLMFAWAVVALFRENEDGFLIAASMWLLGQLIPAILLILKYAKFRVYRVGDAIKVEHGAIQTYRSSFEISKINAICIKRTLAMRLMHKSSIEAEVVGIGGDDSHPVIALVVDDDKVEGLIQILFPGFLCKHGYRTQPIESKKLLLFRAAAWPIVFAAVLLPTQIYMLENDIYFDSYVFTEFVPIAILGICAVLSFWFQHVSFKVMEFGTGEDTFRATVGVIDRSTYEIGYDRVQISTLAAGPMARRNGLAKCRIDLLSSIGKKTVVTGYYSIPELDSIGKTMIERVNNGKYKSFRVN